MRRWQVRGWQEAEVTWVEAGRWMEQIPEMLCPDCPDAV